jgi:hypothetical protein
VKYRIASVLLVLALPGCMQEPDPRGAIEGTWEPLQALPAANGVPVLSYRLAGDRLQMTSSDGRGYDAELGGAEVALDGAPQGTTIVVRQVPAVAYREIVMRDGEPVSARLVAVSNQGVVTVFQNNLDGTSDVFAALRR